MPPKSAHKARAQSRDKQESNTRRIKAKQQASPQGAASAEVNTMGGLNTDAGCRSRLRCALWAVGAALVLLLALMLSAAAAGGGPALGLDALSHFGGGSGGDDNGAHCRDMALRLMQEARAGPAGGRDSAILAALALPGRRVRGLHYADLSQLERELSALPPSLVLRVAPRHHFADAEELRRHLAASFSPARRCVVWVVPLPALGPAAPALKELIEDGRLRGEPVTPPGGRGVLVLAAGGVSRAQLKQRLPHRVVHMFASVNEQEGL